MSWIKVRKDLLDGRVVQQLLEQRLQRDSCACVDACMGFLVRLLMWGDANCDVTGVTGVTPVTLGMVLGDTASVSDLIAIGWLALDSDGRVTFPDWEKHNGSSGRARRENRSSAAERQAAYRARKKAQMAAGDPEAESTPDVTHNALRNALRNGDALEKRREEENRPSVCPPPYPPGGDGVTRYTEPQPDGRTDVEAGPAPEAWPAWVPAARADGWMREVEESAFGLNHVRSSSAWSLGVRQALIQLTAPRPQEPELQREIRLGTSPVPEVVAWLRRLEDRPPGYITAALRSGPLSAAWQHPRLAADQARSRAYSERRAKDGPDVAPTPETPAPAKSGPSAKALAGKEVSHAQAG